MPGQVPPSRNIMILEPMARKQRQQFVVFLIQGISLFPVASGAVQRVTVVACVAEADIEQLGTTAQPQDCILIH